MRGDACKSVLKTEVKTTQVPKRISNKKLVLIDWDCSLMVDLVPGFGPWVEVRGKDSSSVGICRMISKNPETSTAVKYEAKQPVTGS